MCALTCHSLCFTFAQLNFDHRVIKHIRILAKGRGQLCVVTFGILGKKINKNPTNQKPNNKKKWSKQKNEFSNQTDTRLWLINSNDYAIHCTIPFEGKYIQLLSNYIDRQLSGLTMLFRLIQLPCVFLVLFTSGHNYKGMCYLFFFLSYIGQLWS